MLVWLEHSALFLFSWSCLLTLPIPGMNLGLKKWRKETQDAGMQVWRDYTTVKFFNFNLMCIVLNKLLTE